MLNDASLERLALIPENNTVLLSIHRQTPVFFKVPLPENSRLLGQNPGSVLVEIPKANLADFTETEEIMKVVVWGDGSIVVRMDSFLRTAILEQLSLDSTEANPLPIIAIFKEEADDLRSRLEALGASPQSIVGKVVTLAAEPEAVFRILVEPDLVKLEKPKMSYPTGQSPKL